MYIYIIHRYYRIHNYILLTLTLVQLASKWMHWAVTFRHHSDLFRAATSASSQVIPILNKSLLTVLLQLVLGRPGPLLNPGTSQCNACRRIRWWSIRITRPSQRSLLSLEYVIHAALSCSSDSPLRLLLCLSRKCPRCSLAIYDERSSIFSLVLLLQAIHLHYTEGLIRLSLCTTSSSPLG